MYRKLKIANRLAGFTLTEVVVASGLLIIAMVPMLRALTAAHTGTQLDTCPGQT